MSFNFQTYKTVEPVIKTKSEELGAPNELTKDCIDEHLKQLIEKNIQQEFSIGEVEMGIYLKKYVFGTYKIPKKKKRNQLQLYQKKFLKNFLIATYHVPV